MVHDAGALVFGAVQQRLAHPFAVRLSGVAYALVWMVMLLALIRRLTADGQRRGQLTTLACGLMGLGLMPWLLVWSRPEQPIILSATAALLIATGPARGDGRASGRRSRS
jgi:hypothetical protein